MKDHENVCAGLIRLFADHCVVRDQLAALIGHYNSEKQAEWMSSLFAIQRNTLCILDILTDAMKELPCSIPAQEADILEFSSMSKFERINVLAENLATLRENFGLIAENIEFVLVVLQLEDSDYDYLFMATVADLSRATAKTLNALDGR